MNSYAIVAHSSKPNATSLSPLTSPTNFGILDIYENPSGGYDKKCLIGLHSMWLGGNNSAYQTISVLFAATTNPFSWVENVIPGGEYFETEWNLVCFSTCPSYSYFNVGTCSIICQMSNCQTCSAPLVCETCQTDYVPVNGSSYCDSCENVTDTCLSCLNETYCTTCVSGSYGLDNTSFCQLCSTMIAECLYCINYTYCTACLNDTHAVTDSNDACQLCSILIPNCLLCTSNSACIQCADHYGINSTGGCELCSVIIPNCDLCLN